MKNCIFLASVCLLILFASGASLAQQPSASPIPGGVRIDCVLDCPQISVSSPSEVEVGKPLEFKASISRTKAKLSYTWEVNGGVLIEGQGTPTIKVNMTAELNKGVTATLRVGGLDAACATTASCSTALHQGWISAKKFDSYVSTSQTNEKPLLNLFANELKQRPGDKGYILGYGGSRSRAGATQRAVARAKQYLVDTLGMAERRFVTVIAGARKDPTVELWLVPMGASPPTTEPAVDPTKVTSIKPRR
jgi:hypothetical protein